MLPIEPQDADHAALTVAVNCKLWFTTTLGFNGSIVKAEDVDPDRETVCGLLAAESVNVSAALLARDAVGVNTTKALQLAKAARVAPHVMLEILKSEAFVPLMATLLILIAVAPPFSNVADCAELVDPTAVAANAKLVGVTVTPDVDVDPVPDNTAA